jgi:hypothetical protein
MSRLAERRRIVRWARYANHYGDVSMLFIGGRAAARAVWPQGSSPWPYIRMQAKRRLGGNK